MKKFILTVIALLLAPQIAFSTSTWDGNTEEGGFLVPQALIEFCNLDLATVSDRIRMEDCLNALQDHRAIDKKGSLDVSRYAMEDYYTNALANSVTNKLYAAKFALTAKQEDLNVAGDSSNVGANVNEVTKTLNDNAKLQAKFLEQYILSSLTEAAKQFDHELMIKAPIIKDENGTKALEKEFMPVIKDYQGPTYDFRSKDPMEVPSVYEKMAPNCGDYEAQAKEQETTVVAILNVCFRDRVEHLGDTIITRYQKELDEIRELSNSYYDEIGELHDDYLDSKAQMEASIKEREDIYEEAETKIKDEYHMLSREALLKAAEKDKELKKARGKEAKAKVEAERQACWDEISRIREPENKEIYEEKIKADDDIYKIRQSYKEILDAKANAYLDKKEERAAILSQKLEELEEWYDKERSEIEDIILGGG